MQQVWPFPFYSVDEQWQHNACAAMGLQFREKARLRPGVQQVWPFPFYSVDEQWRHNACAAMGLQFREKARLRPGGPQVPLTLPYLRTVKRIHKDGNCLFRCFSYIITGSEDQHMSIRAAILNHMVDIAHFLLSHLITGNYSSVQKYIHDTDMDR